MSIDAHEREEAREPPPTPTPTLKAQDLSVTALYTAQTWAWAGFKGAERFTSQQSEAVFGVTNLALRLSALMTLSLRRPSLPKSLAQRHALIDQRLEALAPTEVIELAAGLSARGLRACDPRTGLAHLERYLELDLPHVIEHKRALLAREPQTERPPEPLPSKLTWRSADLKARPLSALLGELLGEVSAPRGPRLIIAEGLLMYLSAEEQRALWREALKVLQHTGGALLFDLVPSCEQPPPGLIGRWLGALMRRFTGGESFVVDERDRDALMRELREVGFSEVRCYDTPQLAERLGLPFAGERTQQLVFEASCPL